MNSDKPQTSDVIIIGGGPAGIMAALSVKKHHPGKTVTIVDRTFEIGRKFLVAGAGRGNLTNARLVNGWDGYFHGDKTLIDSIFSQFGYREIMEFFKDLGVPTYEERKTDRGKIFPLIDHAKTVRSMLVDRLEELKVEIQCNTAAESILVSDNMWTVSTNHGEFQAHHIILSAGGKTYPSLGSDGSGYDLAQSLGHTIDEPVPSAVPLVSKNMLSHLLQGEKAFMHIVALIDGQQVSESNGDVMFTQFGFSGPAILDVSHDISVRLNREHGSGATLHLSFFPDWRRDALEKELTGRVQKHPKYPLSHILYGLLSEKIAGAVCAVCRFPKGKIAQDISAEDVNNLLDTCFSYTVKVTQTRGWNEAEFTAGGVIASEIIPKTLESKSNEHIYFAGEMVDVDGMVGGYNLSWAWASGFVVGKLG